MTTSKQRPIVEYYRVTRCDGWPHWAVAKTDPFVESEQMAKASAPENLSRLRLQDARGVAVLRCHQHDACHVDEQTGADYARNREQVALEARGIRNLLHRAIQDRVAVVGDEVAAVVVLARRAPNPQLRDRARDVGEAERHHLDRQAFARTEARKKFRGADEHDELLR